MSKKELIKMLNEGLSIEEIPMISNLEELKSIVDKSDLNSLARAKMRKCINHLIKDTLGHAKIITKLIREELK